MMMCGSSLPERGVSMVARTVEQGSGEGQGKRRWAAERWAGQTLWVGLAGPIR
jgi:hypothetical protein